MNKRTEGVTTTDKVLNMKVLSLFDGMSCGQIALKELGNGWTAETIKHMFQFLPDEWKTAEPASGDYMGEY